MAMATLGNQQTWVPYETTKDCSLGFCSIFCPQWCYIIFPPPPPIPNLDDEDTANSSGGTAAFSPLVIAVIGILAAAFLLVSYYTIISKYCTGLDALRRRSIAGTAGGGGADHGEESMRHETEWHGHSPSDGLDEAVIRKIAVYRYRPGEGVVDGTDCSVCLGEFRADDSLRLLPKCSHAFHRQCIDTWLGSHSNCPLCRASIAPVPTAAPPPPLEEPATTNNDSSNSHEVSIVVEDEDTGAGEEESSTEDGRDDAMYKDPLHEHGGDGGGALPIRRLPSSIGDGCTRISIADVLKLSMEKDGGLVGSTGSSRRIIPSDCVV